MFNLAQLRLFSSVALVVMLLAGFAPSVSKFLAAERGQLRFGTLEVCTSEGIKLIPAPELLADRRSQESASGQSPIDAHPHEGDCPFCGNQITKFFISAQVQRPRSNLALRPAAFCDQLPKPLFAWAHSRSRAPPVTA